MDSKLEPNGIPPEQNEIPIESVLIRAAVSPEQQNVEDNVNENIQNDDKNEIPTEPDEENKKSETENELFSDKNNFDFEAPLQKQELSESNTELNKLISEQESPDTNDTPSSTKKVGFSNENETHHDEFKPLLENGESGSYQQSSKKFINRFVLSHVNEEDIDEYKYENLTKPSIKYFVDEKGLIINEKNKGEAHPEKSEHSVSINLGNTDNQKKSSSSLINSKSFYQALFAELLGTYLLVLYVCSFGLPIADPNDSPASINGALGSGLVVTLALLFTGEINILKVFFYIPCQLIGSTLAALTLKSLVSPHIFAGEQNQSIGVTLLNSEISVYQGFGVEAIITFILILTIFASIDGKRKDLGGSFPLSIGFALVAGSLFGGKFTGGSMNPARSFGPALVYSNWKDHQVYWLGPICGAITAALLYKLLVLKTKKVSKQKI